MTCVGEMIQQGHILADLATLKFGKFSENANFQNFVKTPNSLKFKMFYCFSITAMMRITCTMKPH